jgi:hypothetical protein
MIRKPRRPDGWSEADRRVGGSCGSSGGLEPPPNAAALAGFEARLLRGGGSIDRLGRFELRAILGRGSMGTVFKAWDTTLERWVAVKTVRAGVGMAGFWDDDLVRRLVSEAAIVARFNHPHVVAVHDVRDAAGDAAYIVMEDGGHGLSLEALLRSWGGWAPNARRPSWGPSRAPCLPPMRST